MLILVSGSGCTGKSTLAIKLANRLNLPSVIHSDVILRVVQASGCAEEMLRKDEEERRRLATGRRDSGESSNAEIETHNPLLKEYIRRCKLARLALDHDIRRCLVGGKALIIEGKHIDPSMFAEIRREVAPAVAAPPEAASSLSSSSAAAAAAAATESLAGDSGHDQKKQTQRTILKASTPAASAASILAAAASRENAVICVFVLSIDEAGHLLLLRGQQLQRGGSFADASNVIARRQSELRVQGYLTSAKQSADIVRVNVGDPTQTLNELHRRVLDRVLGDRKR